MSAVSDSCPELNTVLVLSAINTPMSEILNVLRLCPIQKLSCVGALQGTYNGTVHVREICKESDTLVHFVSLT